MDDDLPLKEAIYRVTVEVRAVATVAIETYVGLV